MALQPSVFGKPKSFSDLPGVLVPLAAKRVGLTAVLFGVAAVLITTAMDWLVLRAGFWGPIAATAISNLICGIVAGTLVYVLMRHNQQRQAQGLQRLETINEMNRHIRNALQVISFNIRPSTRDTDQLSEITQALNRIQWALREILPKLEPDFSPFEGSARAQQQE